MLTPPMIKKTTQSKNKLSGSESELKDGLSTLIIELRKEKLHYEGYANSSNAMLVEGGKLAAWAFKESIEGIEEVIEKCG